MRRRRAPRRQPDGPGSGSREAPGPIGPALTEGAGEILGRRLDARERERLGRYVTLLLGWGRTMRLVSRLEREWVERALVLDSLLFLRLLPAGARRIMDLGSGAGIPGVPLRIVREDLALTLVEARQRRASFLRAVVRDLGLTGTVVLAERAERLHGSLGGGMDAVLARCAGSAGRTLALAAPFLAPGGIAVVAGPPEERPLEVGEWVSVAAPGDVRARRFAVLRRLM